MFVGFFGLFISPLTLYLRYKKENSSIQEFAEIALDTTFRAATDPTFLKSIVDYNDSKIGAITEENIVGYDYYRLKSNSNVETAYRS